MRSQNWGWLSDRSERSEQAKRSEPETLKLHTTQAIKLYIKQATKTTHKTNKKNDSTTAADERWTRLEKSVKKGTATFGSRGLSFTILPPGLGPSGPHWASMGLC